MIHLFKSALARAFTYTLVTLLVGGLLLGALRLALPYADHLRGTIAAQVGAATGLDAHLGPMAVRLKGWSPELQFHKVRLLDPRDGDTQIAMERLSIDLDLAASLRNLTPEVRALTLIGPRLLVRRQADGRLLVGGIGVGDGDGEPAALDVFLAQGHLRIEAGEPTWIDETGTAPPLTLTGVNSHFVNAQGRHRLALQAQGIASGQLGAQTRQPGDLRLVADLYGEAEAPGLWGGEAYLSFTGASLAPLLRQPLPDGLRLGSGGVRLEAWTRLADGVPVEASARLDTRDLALTSAGPPAERLTLATLGATLHWRSFDRGAPDAAGGPAGWRLDLSDLTLIHEAKVWPTTDLGLVWSDLGGGAWALRGGLRSARLGPFMSLVRAATPILTRLLPLEGLDALDRLLEANPDGSVQGMTWRLTGGPDRGPTWALAGQVTGLSVQPAGAIPGVSGLDLRLSADQAGGQVALSGKAPTLSLPRILRAPLNLTRMAGEVLWRPEPDGRLRIDVPELAIDHAAVRTSTSLGLCLPPGGGSPLLDLQTHFGDGDAAKARPLIPAGILKPRLVEWLDRSIVSGQVPSGAVIFRGHLEDFPFPDHEGRLEVLFDVRDGVLDFLPGWPRLSGATGQVRFLDRIMEITLTGGRILDSQVTGGTAFIDDLFVTRTLKIQASAAGPLADGLRVLREAPLSKGLGRLANLFAVSGGMRLDLDMVVPLHERIEFKLDGQVSWPPGARIGLEGTPVELRDPKGRLHFDPHGVKADGIEAQLYGFPELHLFIGDTVQAVLDREYRVGNVFGPPGVLRSVAELVFGYQTNATVIKAIGWLAERRHWSTKQLMDLFRELVDPKIAMEKSPVTAIKPLYIERAYAFYPDAYYLHLTRHPVATRKSLIEFRKMKQERRMGGIDIPVGHHPVDDLLVWYRFHKNILEFTRTLPLGQSIRVRGEDVLSEPDVYLAQIAEWLGLRTDRKAIEAMKHPEASPYAYRGPSPVHGGNDPNFMRSPHLRPGKIREPSLRDFLARTDIRWTSKDHAETLEDGGFRMAEEEAVMEEIIGMSNSMGYL